MSFEHSVPNPHVPFNGQIRGGLQPGKRIQISGHVRHHCNTFRVDLMAQNGYVALHFNPRFNENVIVRNSEIGGWGPEERHGHFPFRRGENFLLVIVCEGDHYKISVNGQHLFDYFHRLPLHEVSTLSISGDVDCHSIVYSGGSAHHHHHHHHHEQHQPYIPPPQPQHHHHHQPPPPPHGHHQAHNPNEVYNPPIPAAIPLQGRCHPGKMIQIQGTVPHHAKRFEIDLQYGSQYQPQDISLHFNPRWDDPHQPHHPVVVRNHKDFGSWGSEERQHPPFPFHKGNTFDILILCEQHEWKIAVNGQHFVSYHHHGKFGNVNHIYIQGDVSINYVKQFN